MLKKRLVATLIVREGILVQSIRFKTYLPIGKPAIAIEFLNSWGIDEIIIVDITASKDRERKNHAHIREITHSCFVPLTAGGGIDSIEDIQALMSYGADKIVINSKALSTPDFITEAANIFGSQCIVVSIDVAGSSYSDYRVYNAAQEIITNQNPVECAKMAEARGAGEIYLTSVDRDGSKAGFDIALIDSIAGAVEIPVIASGGAEHPGHVLEVFAKTNASAVSVANSFHFVEHSVILTKAVLSKNGVSVRLNTHAHYDTAPVGDHFRLKRRSDHYLQDLLFEKIEKEII